jgi:alpha-L-rhamnosidase
MNIKWILVGAFLLGAALARGATLADLKCEYQTDPLGIDEVKPELSWKIISDLRGDVQTAYQVVVASSAADLDKDQGDLWDSGKVVSDQNLYVPYGGKQLTSQMACFWKVRVWDKDGKESPWSPTGKWTMGLLKPEDWTAKWITVSRWFVPPAYRAPGLMVGAGGWADIDLGASYPLESIKLYPHTAESFPLRFVVLGSDEPQFYRPRTLIDESARDYHVTGPGAQKFALGGVRVRHLRLKILAARGGGAATVRQLEAYSGGKNVALMRMTHEIGTAWNYGHAMALVDGMPSEGEGDACPEDACPTPQAPLLRKSFQVTHEVKRATLYLAAMGMAEVKLNGKTVGDEVESPPFTDYTKRVVYLTHDITPLLTSGENVIGVTLGNGYFSTPTRGFGERQGGDGPPRLLAQAQIEYTDGTSQIIATDGTWKWARSEILFNDIWQGYIEDRRQAKPGWDSPGYVDTTDWRPVGISTSLGGVLHSPMGPPIRVVGELKPSRVENDRAYFSVLTAGWPRLKVDGHAGQTITISGHCAEYALPAMTYVLAADGPTVLQPRFLYLSGPLDVQVSGLQQPLNADDITIQLVHADLKSASDFECSNAFFNKLHEYDLRTHLNYNSDQPADPMREKQGWTQDAQNMFDTAAYLTDVQGFYHKWWWDFADGQETSGYLGTVLPLVGRIEPGWNSPWWSGVIVFLPWEHYKYYGDPRMIEQAYEPMRRYVDFLGKMAESGAGKNWDDYPYFNVNLDAKSAREKMINWNGAGDWINPYTNTQNIVPTYMTTMPAYYYYATIVSKTAAIMGNKADAAKYAALAVDIKNRYNAKYFNPDTGMYGKEANNETALVLPLALGLVPEDKRSLTYQRLIDAIHLRKDHVGCGFVALSYLLQTIAENRETALANKMINQKSYPSWNTLMHDGVFGEMWTGGGAQMPSLGGCIGVWQYQSVLGIRPDMAGPGFKKFILAPQPDPNSGLTWAKGYYDSVQGRIGSDWKCEGDKFTLNAAIPVNTTATVYIPTKDASTVLEAGKPAKDADGVKFLRTEGDVAIFEVGAGTYQFTADYQPPAAADGSIMGKNFSDDFSKGNANWDETSGVWKVAAGQYMQSDIASQGITSIKNRQWKDATYTYSCRFPADAGDSSNWAGFGFRKDDPSSDHTGACYMLYLRVNGDMDLFNGRVLQSVHTGLDTSQPARIKIVTAGPSIKVYLNNDATPRLDVQDDQFSAGYAGFETFHTKASFGTVSVTVPPAP